ncbi:MAG TPA: S-layer homology domain-containing protein [Egibacteraceae bacterium]|jgi:hypothetical protein|nr:S-layer homology domain-containing protein [Egibacteraceae bacterium]
MMATAQDRMALLRYLAVFAAAAMMLTLLPRVGPAHGQDAPEDPTDACPINAPAAAFTDRARIPDAHRANVDCAAHFEIVRGFPDNTYRPRLQVRRDQMATFIAETLDAAGVALPAGTANTFTDVPATNVHANNINRLAAAGIVEGGPLGLPGNRYGVELRTRRDQMATFLMRAAGYAFADDPDAFDSTVQQFTDVPVGNVHFQKVNGAAVAGLAEGIGGGLFAPRRETRRDQMATFVVRLLNFLVVPAIVALDAPPTRAIAQTATATATVLSQLGPAVQGVVVTFVATGTVTVIPPVPQTATTNANGQAFFDYTSVETGTVTVTASVGDPGVNFAFEIAPESVQTQFVAPDIGLLGGVVSRIAAVFS